jgi:hypothetical protein
MTPVRDRESDVRAWRSEGMSNTAIAALLGVSRERIGQVFGRTGACRPRHPPAVISAARMFWDEGHTASEIARLMADCCPTITKTVTKNAVIGIADRNDFPARPSPIIRADSGAGS